MPHSRSQALQRTKIMSLILHGCYRGYWDLAVAPSHRAMSPHSLTILQERLRAWACNPGILLQRFVGFELQGVRDMKDYQEGRSGNRRAVRKTNRL